MSVLERERQVGVCVSEVRRYVTADWLGEGRGGASQQLTVCPRILPAAADFRQRRRGTGDGEGELS